MLKKILCLMLIALMLVSMLTACGGSQDSIVGTWLREDGDEILTFDEDGSCSVPFTYDGGWWESCDTYTVDDDGTLYLVSSKGNIDSERFLLKESVEEVEEDGGYYISGDTLVIKHSKKAYTYTRQ